MTLSAEFCHLQAALQQQRAAETSLDNVREIATLAAAAWQEEAASAERRERRRLLERATGEASLRATDGIAASENPDRGIAEGSAALASIDTVR